MSSSAAASSYWRVAGMNYLKYSNLCAGSLLSPVGALCTSASCPVAHSLSAGFRTQAPGFSSRVGAVSASLGRNIPRLQTRLAVMLGICRCRHGARCHEGAWQDRSQDTRDRLLPLLAVEGRQGHHQWWASLADRISNTQLPGVATFTLP